MTATVTMNDATRRIMSALSGAQHGIHSGADDNDGEDASSIDMSYEALLELEENLGEVKKRGLDEHSIRMLPRRSFDIDLVEERQCVICLTDFLIADSAADVQETAILIGLPCGHHFHAECASGWLRSRASCPVCRKAVRVDDFVDLCSRT